MVGSGWHNVSEWSNMSLMLTAISVTYTIKIQLKAMASTKQTSSSSSHQKESCSCQDIADKLTPLALSITHSHKVTTRSSLIN